jgi:hypothetical protein
VAFVGRPNPSCLAGLVQPVRTRVSGGNVTALQRRARRRNILCWRGAAGRVAVCGLAPSGERHRPVGARREPAPAVPDAAAAA